MASELEGKPSNAVRQSFEMLQKEQAAEEKKQAEKFKFEEGIKSSDEETEGIKAETQQPSVAEPNAAEHQSHELRLASSDLYSDMNERDRISHKYGYSEADLDQFAKTLEETQ